MPIWLLHRNINSSTILHSTSCLEVLKTAPNQYLQFSFLVMMERNSEG